MQLYRSHVLVCGGTGCHSSGSDDVIKVFNEELERHKLQDRSKS